MEGATGFEGLAASSSALRDSDQLDPTFDGDGKVWAGVSNFVASHIIAPTHDKFIVAGTIRGLFGADLFTVVRFTNDGKIDPAWNNGSHTNVNFGTNFARATTFAMQGSKVVVGGHARLNNKYQSALARLNSDGTLDKTFGNQGIIINDYGKETSSIVSVGIDASGRILAVGEASTAGINYLTVTRYLNGGQNDASYGQSGTVRLNVGSNGIGKIAIGSTTSEVYFTRRNTRKVDKIDATGIVPSGYAHDILPEGLSFDRSSTIAVRSDGIVYVSQPTWSSSAWRSSFIEVKPNGSKGITGPSIVTASMPVSSVYSERHSRLYAAGTRSDNNRFEIIALHGSLARDNSFGTGGVTSFDFAANNHERLTSISLRADRIMAVGYQTGSEDLVSAIPVARLLIRVGAHWQPCRSDNTCDAGLECYSSATFEFCKTPDLAPAPAGKPDLVPLSAVFNSSSELVITVKNQGTASSPSFEAIADFYPDCDTDGYFDGADFGPLAAGQTASFTITPYSGPGSYPLWCLPKSVEIEVDWNKMVTESNEGNNITELYF